MADPMPEPMGEPVVDPMGLVSGSVPASPVAASPDPYRPPQIEAILRQLREVVANARPMPLSASSMVNKEELLGLIDEAATRLPEELRAARWLLKEREEFLGKVRREGDEILELALQPSGVVLPWRLLADGRGEAVVDLRPESQFLKH